MSTCPNCGKEINQRASFCIHCQTNLKEKADKEKKERITPLITAIVTFIYPFIVLINYRFFTCRVNFSLAYLISPFLGISIILTLYTIYKKKTFFRFLSLFLNLFVMGRYAIWVNSFEEGAFIL